MTRDNQTDVPGLNPERHGPGAADGSGHPASATHGPTESGSSGQPAVAPAGAKIHGRAWLTAASLVAVPLWGFLRDALPLTLAAGLAVGAVVWLHGHRVTSRFEADGLLPGVLMLAVVSEFGPLAVGLIAATRLASGITAELGTMVATEQVDALRLLGVSPFRRLAQPRVIALVLALPPLTVAVDYAALAGGILGETLFGTLSPTGFLLRAAEPLEPVRVLLWSLKTPVFGIIAGLVACRHGLGCPPDAHAVGRAVTGSVMVATLGVLLADVALVVLIDGLLG